MLGLEAMGTRTHQDKSILRLDKWIFTDKITRKRALMSLYKKEYRKKNREHIAELRRKRRMINRPLVLQTKIEVISHYSQGRNTCACCNESNIAYLTIDHIAGGGKIQRKKYGFAGGYGTYRWLIKNGFPKGYQVLCFPCNLSKNTGKHCILIHRI